MLRPLFPRLRRIQLHSPISTIDRDTTWNGVLVGFECLTAQETQLSFPITTCILCSNHPLLPTTCLPYVHYTVLFTLSTYDTPPHVLFSNDEGKGNKEDQGVMYHHLH